MEYRDMTNFKSTGLKKVDWYNNGSKTQTSIYILLFTTQGSVIHGRKMATSINYKNKSM